MNVYERERKRTRKEKGKEYSSWPFDEHFQMSLRR